jgi:hypothetical protein
MGGSEMPSLTLSRALKGCETVDGPLGVIQVLLEVINRPGGAACRAFRIPSARARTRVQAVVRVASGVKASFVVMLVN